MTGLSPAPKPAPRVRAPRPRKPRTPMKRSWLRRAADAVATLVRRTPVKRQRATPRRKAHPANRELRKWVADRACCICCVWSSPAATCAGTVDPHHVRTRGAGGGEVANLVPLCRAHHDELHQMGRKSFALKYGVNLVELAQEYTLRWTIETNQPASRTPEASQ